MFIVTTDVDGEPDRKVFDTLPGARAHAAKARAGGFATSIHEAEATSPGEAIHLFKMAEATLIETRPADPSPSEMQRRWNTLSADDLGL